jgi:hypothetical protein
MPTLRARLLSGWVTTLSILLASSVAYPAPKEEALLIVDGARNLFRIPYSTVARQISYTMELTYPARAIGDQQWEQLRQNGWVQCNSVVPNQAAANSDWDHFSDASVTPNRTIHQHLTNWFKGDQLITISLRYYSGTRNGYAKSTPDNAGQHVDLIFHDEHGREAAEWVQLDCVR